jgi:hypothetical protein
VVLKALYDEEEAELAFRTAAVTSSLVGNHIHDTNALKDFIKKQVDLL